MMEKVITGRHMLVILVCLTLGLALSCLLLGISSGEKILYDMDLVWIVKELTSATIPMIAVVCVAMLIQFAIGIGLCLKGATEGLMKSVVPGKIVSSMIRSVPGDTDTEYRVCSVVSYYIDGVAHEKEGRHHHSSADENEVRKRLAGIHPGDPVNVFYKPGDPEVIELDNSPTRTMLPILVGAWILVTGLVAMFLVGSAIGA
jgi:hypothetical protein